MSHSKLGCLKLQLLPHPNLFTSVYFVFSLKCLLAPPTSYGIQLFIVCVLLFQPSPKLLEWTLLQGKAPVSVLLPAAFQALTTASDPKADTQRSTRLIRVVWWFWQGAIRQFGFKVAKLEAEKESRTTDWILKSRSIDQYLAKSKYSLQVKCWSASILCENGWCSWSESWKSHWGQGESTKNRRNLTLDPLNSLSVLLTLQKERIFHSKAHTGMQFGGRGNIPREIREDRFLVTPFLPLCPRCMPGG